MYVGAKIGSEEKIGFFTICFEALMGMVQLSESLPLSSGRLASYGLLFARNKYVVYEGRSPFGSDLHASAKTFLAYASCSMTFQEAGLPASDLACTRGVRKASAFYLSVR